MHKNFMKLVVACAAGLGACAIATVLIFNMVRHVIIEENKALVHSVAQSLLPALLVNDKEQVDALLKALEGYPGIESAELISAEGTSIASYAKAGQMLVPTSQSFELASAVDDPNQVHVMAPITFDNLIVANLHIAINLWTIYVRIFTWLGVLLIALSLIYVVIKQLKTTIRFENLANDRGSDPDDVPFDVNQAMSEAVHDAGINLEYQPIQRMSDGGLFGIEVVVCWRDPSGQTKHLSPSDFMGLAAEIGISMPFDDWLLKTACTHASAWQLQYGPLILAINITEKQFKDPAFAQKVRDVCAQTQYPHQLLELGVSESVISSQPTVALSCIQSLQAQGLSVTIEGFGLAKNSLEMLDLLPIHKVKLDRHLVMRVQHDAQVFELIQATILQALSHDVQVIADGLDAAEQRFALQRMGCILGQGTYFHPPLAASDFANHLASLTFDVFARPVLEIKGSLKGEHANGFSAA